MSSKTPRESHRDRSPRRVQRTGASRSPAWILLHRFLDLCSLARPTNGAITFAAILAAGYLAAPGATAWPRVCLGALCGVLIGASGNILNDILDIEIDRVNRPGRALPSGTIGVRAAWILFTCAAVAGLALSSWLGLAAFLFTAVSLLIVVAYDAFLKKIPLVGNAVVGAMTGAALVYGALIGGSAAAGVLPGLFAFMTNATREIVKDMEDVAGDAARGVRTFPVRAGMRAANILVTVCLLVIAAASPLPWVAGLVRLPYLIVTLATVVPLLIFLTFVMRTAPDGHAASRVSAGLKATMVLGIIAFIIGSVWSGE
jgi:geranylgeranylglycerol-phosphate geranylgeranyltransferase